MPLSAERTQAPVVGTLAPADRLTECANCGARGMAPFYECRDTPVNSVVLVRSRPEAIDFSRGKVVLGFCSECQFISNMAFDKTLAQYGEGYESTQRFSPTFNAFHRALAQELVDRYGLRNRTVIEIGCGQGEFLDLLCTLGPNSGIGFDPAFNAARSELTAHGRVKVIADFYGETYAQYRADFICCKQTLEHIPRPGDFVRDLRRSVGDGSEATIFFQVPDVTRILEQAAFWDIYYEHCSYFCAASLSRAFSQSGFRVVQSRLDYGGQYVALEAKTEGGPGDEAQPLGRTAELVRSFGARAAAKIDQYHRLIGDAGRAGRRVVLWGGGSKAVAFITTLGLSAEIDYVVDVNPHKHGTYLPGSGHPVVGPETLRDAPPSVVIVMNPIYSDEIKDQIGAVGINTAAVDVMALT